MPEVKGGGVVGVGFSQNVATTSGMHRLSFNYRLGYRCKMDSNLFLRVAWISTDAIWQSAYFTVTPDCTVEIDYGYQSISTDVNLSAAGPSLFQILLCVVAPEPGCWLECFINSVSLKKIL